MDPVVELLRAQLEPDLVGTDVARDLEDLGHGQRLVAVALGVVDPPVGDLQHRGDLHLGAGRDQSVLERAGDRDRLERRARLVVEADGSILVGVGRGSRDVVGVHPRPVGQRQDRAGVGVHDDRGRALGRVLGSDAREHLLDLVLEGGVDRQLQGLAGPRLVHVVDRDRLPDGVVDDPPDSVLTPQHAIELPLDRARRPRSPSPPRRGPATRPTSVGSSA